jgi:hypothetical protein
VNTEFTGVEAWILNRGASLSPSGRMLIPGSANVGQFVPVQPDRVYQQEIVVRCEQPTQGRMQVNWRDSRGNRIAVDRKVFDCAEHGSRHKQSVTAPRDAAVGVVYVVLHTGKPVRVLRVSLR